MPETADRTPRMHELADALKAADPRARLVAPRILRRVIKSEQRLGLFGIHRAHRKSLTVATASARKAADPEELGAMPGESLPEMLFLIAIPDPDELEARSPGDALLWGWRMLFHCAIHAEIGSKRLTRADADERWRALGPLASEEIRGVLERDGWLITPCDPASAYEEFAAVYLETRHFAGTLLAAYFPVVDDFARLDEILREDVDGDAILAKMRPAGASDPHPAAPSRVEPARPAAIASGDEVARKSEPTYQWLMKRADVAARVGNVVRAAIHRARAAKLVGPTLAGRARGKAEDEMGQLCRRLRAAVGDAACDVEGWRAALSELLARTADGVRTAEARLLLDLQNACVDFERTISTIDLLGWLVTLGRRPLRRALPNQTLVRMARHLQKASGRVFKARLGEVHRAALAVMLDCALKHAQARVRERFRPLISQALTRAGLKARNLPERVSFRKMVEELVDRVVDRNFLTMGDVRDAISRSQVRAPDLSGPREFFKGDRVLHANRRLRVSLDGIYHAGEIYLRMLQRMSLLAFGTKPGRWLTLYVALPFGGAFGALVTLQELAGLGLKLVPTGHPSTHYEMRMLHAWTIVPLGVFLLGVIHSRRFRSLALACGLRAGAVMRGVLLDAPAWVLSRPGLQAVLRSRAFSLARRTLLIPGAVAGMAFGLVVGIDGDRRVALGIAAAVSAVMAVLLNTRLGRNAEEFAADGLAMGYRRLRADLLPGLVRFFLDIFGFLLETVERVIYAVDEWLRYRSGQGRLAFGAKAVLGAFWFFLTYLIRIYVNLLIEPQVNPVKHFPTVTVAAKMIIPQIPTLVAAMAAALHFLGPVAANAVAWFTVFFLPGIAGFIVWELKENWRLYEANRPKTLRPVPIGHHGETMRRLLRPGFHSGTVPKLFAKLRRAERAALRQGRGPATIKAIEALHHVEGPIRHFVDRDLIATVEAAGKRCRVELERVDLATNRIRIRLASDEAPGNDLVLAFEDQSGRLHANLIRAGWLDEWPEDDRRRWHLALEGFAAMAGVESLRNAPWTDPAAPLVVAWDDWVTCWAHEEDASSEATHPEPERAI